VTIYGAIYHYGPVVDETLTNMYGKTTTSSWTNTDWFGYELMALVMDAALFVVYALMLGFIGLYLGSMHKPSPKTKE
jgi:hypothetical protein